MKEYPKVTKELTPKRSQIELRISSPVGLPWSAVAVFEYWDQDEAGTRSNIHRNEISLSQLEILAMPNAAEITAGIRDFLAGKMDEKEVS
jgi:hypothetical protein